MVASGLEPTPGLLAPFIVAALERSGGMTRSAIVKLIEAEWASAGGQPMKSSTTSRVKRAMSTLVEGGVVENPVHGFYRLVDALSDDAPMEFTASIVGHADEVDDEPEELGSPPEVSLGKGDQFVYAFYLSTYRRLAEADGQDVWPLKIGMTTTSVEQRMASHRTALPEEPSMAAVIRTGDAATLENIIQWVLTLRGRKLESGGSEWFLSNPGELVSIYEFVLGSSSDELTGS